MSHATYPEPQYLGEGGEVTAIRRPADAPPEIARANGTTIHYLATGASTGGLFGLYRYEMAAGARGPGPHFHRTITESFHILAGTVEIFDGTDWVACGPGDFAHVPIGGIHGFRNGADAPASMLLHFSPGAPREAYFEGIPGVGDMTEEERTAFYLAHDNHWL